MVGASHRRRVRFSDFELELETGELKRNGELVKLPPQPSQVLVLLVEHHGSVVTREQLREELWPDGTVVDYDQSINFCIKRVREALSDDRIIETVPRKGWVPAGEWLQQECINKGLDGRVRPNPEGERKHRDRGKSRASPEHARTVLDVLPE